METEALIEAGMGFRKSVSLIVMQGAIKSSSDGKVHVSFLYKTSISLHRSELRLQGSRTPRRFLSAG